MKKIFAVFALFAALVFVVSCGGDSVKRVIGDKDSISNFGKLGGECYPNKTCDKGLICDKENNVCVEDQGTQTDTGSDKPGNLENPDEQNNNQNDQGNQLEQPDENHQEDQNDTDTPDEQPDQDNPNEDDDTDTSDEQPDQDNPNEDDDTDTSGEQPDQDVPDPQDNQGKCDPGYVWVDYDIDYWVHKDINDGVSHDKQCFACVNIPTVYELARKTHDTYCPGGDDLKDENLLDQLRSCPKGQIATANLDACVCPYGAPPPPNGECLTAINSQLLSNF